MASTHNELLKDRSRRRWWFGSALTALVALVAVRYFVLPYFTETDVPAPAEIVGHVVDALLISLLASLAVTSLLLWLNPPSRTPAAVDVVQPKSIADTLQEARRDTSIWWYRGHSGRHFRSVTLPALVQASRDKGVSKRVVLQILDPTDQEVCEYYARYRQALRTAKPDNPWTSERVSLELFATIVSAYAWRAAHPPLAVEMALLDSVSLFRVDLSDRLALVTKEDPQEPALRCDAGTIFFLSYREDLRLSLEQSRSLRTPEAAETLTDLSVPGVRALFDSLGLKDTGLTDDQVRQVIALAQRADNPYA